MRHIINPLFLISAVLLLLTACEGGNEKTKTPCELAAENDTTKNIKVDRTAVKSERAGLNEVVIHIAGDIDKLNALTYSAADAGYAIEKLYCQLLDVDPDSFTLYPVLVKARPEIKMITEGEYKDGMSMTWELRPEATWDNGTPITADDVIFT